MAFSGWRWLSRRIWRKRLRRPAAKKKVPAKKTPAKVEKDEKAPAKKAPPKKAPEEKAPAKKAPAKEAPAKKGPAKKAPPKKAPAEKGPAKKAPPKQVEPSEPAPKQASRPARKQQVKIFKLQHARAADMAGIVSDLMGDQTRASADQRTNSLLVRGDGDALKVVEEMLLRLDEPVKPKEPRKPEKSKEAATKTTAVLSAARGANALVAVAANGAKVNKGDQLFKLDSSRIEAELQRLMVEQAQLQSRLQLQDAQRKRTSSVAEAELVNAQSNLQQAKIDKEAFLSGKKVVAEKQLDAAIAVAQEALALAQTRVASSDREFQIKKAKAELEVAQLQKKVFDQFTVPRELIVLDAEIKKAENEVKLVQAEQNATTQDLAAELQALELERKQHAQHVERLRQELKKYVQQAPRAGTVRHATSLGKGAVVRQGQTVVLLESKAAD